LQTMFGEGTIRRIEYYGRLMDWHTKLTDRKRTLYHLTAYRWPLVKQLTHLRHWMSARAANVGAKADAYPTGEANQ